MPPKGSKRILAAASQATRAADRREIGSLRDNRVRGRTLQKYQRAVSMFLAFNMFHGVCLAADMDVLDQQLCIFLEALWAEGEPKGLAGDVLSGAGLLLNTRRVFPGAWRLFSVWNKLEVPHRVPPMSYSTLAALIGICVSQERWGLGAALLVSWHCILRTGELCGITCGAITLGPGRTGVLELGWTKGALRKGATESVKIEDPGVGWCIAFAIRRCGIKPGSLLMNMSASDFRRWFDSALVTLALKDSGLRPYSIRRGSATSDFVRFENMSRTCERGRWSDVRTARIYIVAGKAALAEWISTAQSQALSQPYIELARRWILSAQ